MRISDWSSDVCSSDLATVMSVAAEYLPAVHAASGLDLNQAPPAPDGIGNIINPVCVLYYAACNHANPARACTAPRWRFVLAITVLRPSCRLAASRSEEHTSELQSLMRISYAVFCLKKKQKTNTRDKSI